jgi:hypothetical protein
MRFSPMTYLTLGAGSVEIEVQKAPTMVAPAQVWLRAVNYTGLSTSFEETGSVYEGEHHEYYHEWTIDGEPLSDWNKTPNLIPAYNNPNKAFGREVAFLLPYAGSYTITLVVRDHFGNEATATTSTLTVVDPLSYYNTSRRIYVDPDGDFTGVPASDGSGAPRTATTIDSLITQLGFYTWNVNPPMVLFRGGKTHDFGTKSPGNVNDDGFMKVEQASPGQYFTSFGTGRAKFIPSTFANRNFSRAMFEVWGRPVTDFITFTGFDVEGNYNAATERGSIGNGAVFGFDANSQLVDSFVMIHDVTTTGMDATIQSGGKGISSNNRQMVADCYFTNWRNYGCFGGNMTYRYAFVGNRLTQNVDALHGGDKDDALVNNHGPLRIQMGAHAYVAMNDIFSRSGWSPANSVSGHDDQPCLRVMVDPRVGQAAHIERNVMEGGYQVINIEDAVQAGASFPAVPANFVVENNLLVGTAKTWGAAVHTWRSGLTVRNNIFVMPDVPTNRSFGNPAVFDLSAPQNTSVGSADNPSNPIVVHSNTAINLKDEPNADGRAWALYTNGASYFTNALQENNVQHNPNMTNSVTTYAPIDVSTVLSGFTPRFKGVRYGYEVAIRTLSSTVADGGSFTVPYSAIQKRLNDQTLVSGGGATDQAYWTAISGTDTKHAIYIFTDAKYLYAELGHISVSFGASDITITNNSGFDWASGRNVAVHLDRTSLIPAMDTSFASPATIPLPRPTTGSSAIGAATTGRVHPKDALLATRNSPPETGALNAA